MNFDEVLPRQQFATKPELETELLRQGMAKVMRDHAALLLNTGPPQIMPAKKPDTARQKAILRALNGKTLIRDGLAREVKCDPSTLYKKGGLSELIAAGRVKHETGVGYYRPDALPADK